MLALRSVPIAFRSLGNPADRRTERGSSPFLFQPLFYIRPSTSFDFPMSNTV